MENTPYAMFSGTTESRLMSGEGINGCKKFEVRVATDKRCIATEISKVVIDTVSQIECRLTINAGAKVPDLNAKLELGDYIPNVKAKAIVLEITSVYEHGAPPNFPDGFAMAPLLMHTIVRGVTTGPVDVIQQAGET